MSSQLREFVIFVTELILLGVIVVFAMLGIYVGKQSLNEYVSQEYSKNKFSKVLVYTKGSIGYYELVDLIDSYGSTIDITISYRDNAGITRTITYTHALTKNTVRLAVGSVPKIGEDYTGIVYSRYDGKLYRDGMVTTSSMLEYDMNIKAGSLSYINGLVGNGVLDYSFIEGMYKWLEDERFICIVKKYQGTDIIESIAIDLQG